MSRPRTSGKESAVRARVIAAIRAEEAPVNVSLHPDYPRYEPTEMQKQRVTAVNRALHKLRQSEAGTPDDRRRAYHQARRAERALAIYLDAWKAVHEP